MRETLALPLPMFSFGIPFHTHYASVGIAYNFLIFG